MKLSNLYSISVKKKLKDRCLKKNTDHSYSLIIIVSHPNHCGSNIKLLLYLCRFNGKNTVLCFPFTISEEFPSVLLVSFI